MSILEYLKEKNLAWQPSFSGEVASGLTAYRGSMIVEEGKQISPDRQLPPKIQAKQVILVNEDEKIKFFTCELEAFSHIEPFLEKYKEFFAPDSINVLYVINLDGSGTFEYQGLKFTALVLDENSVWNEILELADLDKGDMKKMSSEEKIEALFEAIKDTDTDETSRTFDEMKTLEGETKKTMMGAV